MYKTEIISKFGGINKLKDAIKTKSLYDVYCWENGNWYTQRYWIHIASKNLKGETLLDLMTGIPLDATHFSGPLFLKKDEKGNVYEWVPKLKKWLYVGWHPNASIKPLD